MFKFFKKKGKYPYFRILTSFHRKNFYFLRNAEWASVDAENILVTDPRTLDVLPLSGWSQVVFVSASGEKTIDEFIYFIADRYTGAIPESLDQVIIFELFDLEKKGLILITDKKQTLAKEFDLPGLGGIK